MLGTGQQDKMDWISRTRSFFVQTDFRWKPGERLILSSRYFAAQSLMLHSENADSIAIPLS
jgi:hypothetical protein